MIPTERERTEGESEEDIEECMYMIVCVEKTKEEKHKYMIHVMEMLCWIIENEEYRTTTEEE